MATRIVFLVLFVIALAGGGLVLSKSESAVHETEALVIFAIGAIFLTGALLHSAIERVAAGKKPTS
jgi:hypothetical protein